MVFIVGLFGFVGSLLSLISGIILLCNSAVWYGIAMLISTIYVLAFTILLIRLDGKATKAENRLTKQMTAINELREKLGLPPLEESDDYDDDEEDYDEEYEESDENLNEEENS